MIDFKGFRSYVCFFGGAWIYSTCEGLGADVGFDISRGETASAKS